jgi:phenylacetic acid degradation operon negative regulatory protein
MLGTDGGVVRTAVSRLAADGWLDRDKAGRKSFYKLAKRGRERFEAAVEHVYNPHPSDWAGRFELLLIGNGADRDASRAALTEAGFGSPVPGVWVAPSNVPTPSIAKGAIRLEVSADDAEGRRLVEASWSLERTAESYREFMKTFAPLEDWVRAANDIAPADAILARVLLIHHYRRVILRDPCFPHRFCRRMARPGGAEILRQSLSGASAGLRSWLDTHGRAPPAACSRRGRNSRGGSRTCSAICYKITCLEIFLLYIRCRLPGGNGDVHPSPQYI